MFVHSSRFSIEKEKGHLTCVCKKCGIKFKSHNYRTRWCIRCDHPGIDADYEEFNNLLEEGYEFVEAAILSGWIGSEHFSN